MPELPEVETTVRDLRPQLVGRTIRRASVTWHKTIAHPDAEGFVSEIAGCKVTNITRRGKYLIFCLERPPVKKPRTARERAAGPVEGAGGGAEKFLLVHLRMTGSFKFQSPDEARDAHMHVTLALDDGRELRFRDFRKFGRWWLVDAPDEVVGKLGPEPLDMSKQEFVARLRARRGRIKPLLLNQAFIAGVGNIYADESLWYARLHPLREVTTLSDAEASALYHAIRRVFTKAIGLGGTSFDANYRRINGMSGEFQEDLRVVGRAGEPCRRCGTPIVKTVVGQRGTYYCPGCQKL
jgi:formamidopyrimidine-DNA glycosylase